MKKLIHSIIVLLLSATVFAQAPQSFKYQAVARDASGEVIADQQVSFQISILQGTESGTAVYTEIHVDSTNQFGLVTLEIGTGTTTDDFTTIDWGNGTYFIQIEMDATGGTSYTLMGTSQLLSVPYSLHAKTADSITGTVTENDPVYDASVASGITGTDTTNWNNKLDSETQNLADVLSQSNDGNATQIKNLADPTDDQDAATKAYIDLFLERIEALEIETGLIAKDYDGNIYSTIEIGNQVWMAENLKTTHYADGTEIPLVKDNTEWTNLGDNSTDDAYCWYNNDSARYAGTYGALYTWAAAMKKATSSSSNPSGVQGVCPDGWHLPSDDEWKELEMHLGMSQSDADNTGARGTNEGSKLAGNASLWNNGDLKNNSEFATSNFSCLPGGSRRGSDGLFGFMGHEGYWLSATEDSNNKAWNRYLGAWNSEISRYSYNKSGGDSIRCIKDE